MDDFFTRKTCTRCGGSLEAGRIMSMYNRDCLCMKCKEEETRRTDYKEAREAERAQVAQGNYNFDGIGLNSL